MALEYWDAYRRKFVLYDSQHEHSEDCLRYPFDAIPIRIFLDTNVINLLVKQSAYIFELEGLGQDLPGFMGLQTEALMHLFQLGSPPGWTLVASAKSMMEISDTPNARLRNMLRAYVAEIVEDLGDRAIFAAEFGQRLAGSDILSALPDVSDRELLGNAIAMECDVFCTCDKKTIISKRSKAGALPTRILTPAEWWAHVKPWAGLWS